MRAAAISLGALALVACAGPGAQRPTADGADVVRVLHGKATWYGGKWHGRKTASGEIFDQNAMTAAHKKLPFGTRVRVTNLENGRSVIVRINDRGPYGKGRIIDVSRAAARELRMIDTGVVDAKVEVLADRE